MNYTILADPIRGWKFDNKSRKTGLNRKPKSGMTRIKKYRKMLEQQKINFNEVFIPADTVHYPESLKELHQKFTEYDVNQDLYVFIL